ncbi:MAG: CPBP family intramembrane metalloprotease [Candidatus Aminicenantes bacterium]|nr:CPBP family intramembrane metalloprotease [Candidatus Aminicenantes bacterium]
MTGSASAPGEKHSLLLPLLAAGLFVPLFIFRATGPLDFWSSLSLSVAFLGVLALGVDPTYYAFIRHDFRTQTGRKILLGVISAAALYGVFFLGNALSRQVWPSAAEGIGRIYGFKAGASPVRIALLMAFIIGPGEEIFWRGYLQRAWQARWGNTAGWLLASGLYALVHTGSLNPMLVLAALVCGIFWGSLFLKYRSPLMLGVSHILWDLLVFVVLPFS